MKKFSLLLIPAVLIALVILAGVIYRKSGNTDNRNSFTRSGCHQVNGENNNLIDCDGAAFAKQFSCRIGGYVSTAFGFPMVACRTHADRSESEIAKYFSCSGGMLWQCSSYIAYIDGKFTEIKNTQDLISHVGDIATPEQAEWLVAATKQIVPSMAGPNAEKTQSVPTVFKDGSFIVVGYWKPVFGCYTPDKKYPVERLTYGVKSDGSVTLISKEVAYEYQGSGICVD